MNFGYVIKKSDNSYNVNVNLNQIGSGYNVVPKTVDKYNKYDIKEVKAYCEANPQMVLAEHPLEQKYKLDEEMNDLKRYLSETDYMAIKCAEKNVSMASEYPEDFVKRQQSRDRINEIRTILGEA